MDYGRSQTPPYAFEKEETTNKEDKLLKEEKAGSSKWQILHGLMVLLCPQ